MSEEKELKPCPFCGGEAELQLKYACLVERWSAMCKNKKCIGRGHKSFGNKAHAISAWNRRYYE